MKTNLATVVSRQLPEFIRDDYPAFVAFIEAYYTWLKDQQLSLEDTRDLDTTLEEYIQYFKKELGAQLPTLLEDERLVLPRIKELYQAKGSEASYKLLFRLMFGKNVELWYPSQQILKASDGTWNQEISVFAKLDYGTPDMVVGKLVDIVTAGRTIRVLVDRREVLTGEVDRIVALGGNIYEFFLDKRFFGNINVGDKIKYRDVFQAEVLPATQKPIINQAGRNFRVGQVFQINSGGGTGALLKVTQVDSVGGIKYAEIIKFGVGYSSDFGISLLASNSVNSSTGDQNTSSSTYNGVDLAIRDRTLGFDEQGYINLANWADYTYVDASYAGTIVREFALNYRNAQVNSIDPAQIRINLGALVRYPGYYTSNNGFLDDSVKVQDSKFYQKYSYVVRIDEKLETYKAAVKTLLHPAGMALFGEYNITNKFDLALALECVVKSLGIGLEDYIDDLTELVTRSVGKALGGQLMFSGASESTQVTFTDSKTLSFGKVLGSQYLYGGSVLGSTSVSPSDSTTFNFSKSLNSHYLYGGSVADNNSVTMQSGITAKTLFKALGSQYLYGGAVLESSAVTMLDTTLSFSFVKALATTTVGTLTDVATIQFTKPLATTTVGTWSDTATIQFTKVLSDNSVGTFNETVTTSFGKSLADTSVGTFNETVTTSFGKSLADTSVGTFNETVTLQATKYVTDTSVGTWSNSGKVWFNSYQGQDYYSEEYSVGLQTTFTN